MTVSITSFVWIVSQPLASVVLPRNAMVTAAADPGLTPVIPRPSQGTAVRHSVLVSIAAAIAVIPILALAPLVWGPGFGRTLTLALILLSGVALLWVGRVMVATFTGERPANETLLVGLVSFPLTFVAFLIVIPDHASTGAAIVSCCSYVVASGRAAYLFLRAPRAHQCAAALVPNSVDLRDYARLGRLRARCAQEHDDIWHQPDSLATTVSQHASASRSTSPVSLAEVLEPAGSRRASGSRRTGSTR